MGTEWPLAGRNVELARLEGLLAEASSRGVVLAGGAGVGKTRLAAELAAGAARAGFVVARVTGTRAASALPLGALAALLPAVDDDWEGVTVDDRGELLRRSAAALARQSDGRRLLFLVDDAHLLDGASAMLTHQLAATGAAFVLATVRTGEIVPDPVVALWKDGLVERIEVGGLGQEPIGDLLTSVLGGPVDRATVVELADRCQGNVLYLRELVLGARSDGTLRDDGGIWRLAGPLLPSERLIELVEARLANLDSAERDLLELVSFDEPLGSAELAALSDWRVADALERKALLVSTLNRRRLEVRLAHPLYGDVLRARIPAVRMQSIARSLADVVEATGARRREDSLRVGTWRLDGGGGEPALLLAAASTARWRYDFPLAERLARAAAEVGGGFEAALLAAQVVSLQGRGVEAEAELGPLARQAATDAERGAVVLTRLDNLAFSMGWMDRAIRIAEEAEETLVEPIWRDEVRARHSAILLATRGPRAGAEIAEPLLASAKGRALAWAGLTASFSLGRLGRLGAALEAVQLGVEAHRASEEPLPWYPCFHTFARCEALAHAGRFVEAETLAREEYRLALEDRSAEAQAFFAWQLSRSVGERGGVGAAVRYGREAAALFRALGRLPMLQNSLIHLVMALALAGEAEESARSLAELDGLGLPPAGWTAVDLFQARAWTAVSAADLPRGRLYLEEAAALGGATGDVVGEASALHGLARLGDARDVVDRLAALADEIEGDLAPARAAHTQALARGDATGLSAVATAFEAMGAALLAAEAAGDAAVALRRQGDGREVAAAERRAATLAAVCRGAVTPALAAVTIRATLTRAEREAALLAAAGRSNKEIAEELFLSVRTIEARLLKVYEKLGVSGRNELAVALGQAS